MAATVTLFDAQTADGDSSAAVFTAGGLGQRRDPQSVEAAGDRGQCWWFDEFVGDGDPLDDDAGLTSNGLVSLSSRTQRDSHHE